MAAYSLITIIVMTALPIAQLLVRNYVAFVFSWEEAVCWQGIMKLSNNYSVIIDATLGIYYLPKLAAIQSVAKYKR